MNHIPSGGNRIHQFNQEHISPSIETLETILIIGKPAGQAVFSSMPAFISIEIRSDSSSMRKGL